MISNYLFFIRYFRTFLAIRTRRLPYRLTPLGNRRARELCHFLEAGEVEQGGCGELLKSTLADVEESLKWIIYYKQRLNFLFGIGL